MIARVHDSTHATKRLNVRHRDGFNLHPITEGAAARVTRRHHPRRRVVACQPHKKMKPVDARVDDVPVLTLHLEKSQVTNFAVPDTRQNLEAGIFGK